MKLGEHTYNTTGWTPRAPIVKAFDCGAGPLRAAHPEALLFYRRYIGDFNADADGGEMARRTLDDLHGFRAPGRLWIELFVGPGQERLDALEAQVRAALPVCRTAGVGLAGCSWYTGQPEPSVWRQMRDHGWYGLDPAIDCISVQEYTKTGTLDDPVNVGRFKALIDAGWRGRIAILEAGMDVNGQPGGGWIGKLTEDQFYAYLHAYDALLGQYPQVVGATVFNAPGWSSFEFHDPRGEFTIMTYDQAKAELMQELGWTQDYADKAQAYYLQSGQEFTTENAFYWAFSDTTIDPDTGKPNNQPWLDGLAGWNPRPSGGTTVPNFVIGPGFQAKIAEKGWHAASDEVYFTQDANAKLSVISCDEGLMFYDSENNKVGVLPFE